MNGYTLMHEHITIDLSEEKGDQDCRLDCFKESADECKKLYDLGVRRILDVTNHGMGQDPAYVSKMELETGIKMIQSTGYYKEPFLPDCVKHMTVEELAERMISEIMSGIGRSTDKAGVIGEFGTGIDGMSTLEKKVFDAAILAAKETKVPVTTHTTLGTFGREQAKYLLDHGLESEQIIIGHMDLSNDISVITEVLNEGVTIGFDTIGKIHYVPDERRAEMLMELERKGYLGQVVCSMDITRKSHLAGRGGIGYSYLFETFLPMLRGLGMKEKSIDQMLTVNPERILGR